MAEEQLRAPEEVPSRIERKVYQPDIEEEAVDSSHHRPSFINFVCMLAVGAVFDVIGLFVSEIPFVGAGLSFISTCIFIPWFHFSGMKFNNKRVISMGVQTISEAIPLVGNLPLITVNIIYSYYSN